MQRITLEEFRDAIQGSMEPLVDGRLIPIVDGQALEIASGDGYIGMPITFWLWSKDAFDEYKKELVHVWSDVAQQRSAPAQPAVPEGMALVPVDAKPEIMEAAMTVHDKWAWRNFPAMWEAMLAATPEKGGAA